MGQTRGAADDANGHPKRPTRASKDSFLVWPRRRTAELGVVRDFMSALGPSCDFHSPRSAAQDPPDVIAWSSARTPIAIEVTQLVDAETMQQRKRNPRQPEFVRWEHTTFVARLRERLEIKDRKLFLGGPYTKVIVLVYTDEPGLPWRETARHLEHLAFGGIQQITEAFLMFSFDAALQRCPVVRLRIHR